MTLGLTLCPDKRNIVTMTIWVPDLSNRDGPLYTAIADAIDDAVRSGDLPPDSRLPPQRELAWRLGVTVGTVTRAYALAEQRGAVSAHVGRGTFVRPSSGYAVTSPYFPDPAPNIIDLSVNTPLYDLPSEALRQAMADLSRRPDLDALLRYTPDRGHERHRAAGAVWMRRVGIETAPDCVVLANGVQQGLTTALLTLTQPGDTVLTEELTYGGIIEAAQICRVGLRGLAMDTDGIIPDALAELAAETGARVLVTNPTIHNPTSIDVPEQRRRELLAIAEAHDMLIIEDDVYGNLPAERAPPMATLAPDRVVYVTSASKCMAPGLRVAWLACPEKLAGRIAESIHMQAVCLPPLTAEIATMWIEDGTGDELAQRIADEATARQALAATAFDGLDWHSHPNGFHGLLYLPSPWRRETFAAAAAQRGVRIVPAGTFAVGQTTAPHAVRLALIAARDRAVLGQALSTLSELARSAPGSRGIVI